MALEKQEEQKKGGCPDWLATYGDLVTLVLTFFVLLYSFSTLDAQKWQQVAAALSGNPSVFEELANVEAPPLDTSNLDTEDFDTDIDAETAEEVMETIMDNADEWSMLAKRLSDFLYNNGLQEEISMEASELEIIMRLSGDLLFDSGRDEIKPDAQQVLVALVGGEILPNMDLIGYVRIEGHTDNLPIHTERFRNNWDLATARAVSVYLFMESSFPEQVTPKLFATMGWGENWPVADNGTAEGRAHNRRVEFVLVNPTVEDKR